MSIRKYITPGTANITTIKIKNNKAQQARVLIVRDIEHVKNTVVFIGEKRL